MALHQPVMVHHHMPKWLEYVGLAVIVVALALGAWFVADRVGFTTQHATSATQALVITGTNGGGLNYTGIPYPASHELVVLGANGGGLRYTGIPYPASHELVVLGADGGGLRYTGIPYP
jgi:hypothetical protein